MEQNLSSKVLWNTEVRMIPLGEIAVDPGQPRRTVATGDKAEALKGLVESIRSIGIAVPLLVRPAPAGKGYLLVAGHRRLAAAKVAELPFVPAIVRELSDQDARTLQLVENLQREDLTPLEEAQGYRSLLELGLSQRDVAERIGRTQAHVSTMVRLLDLPAKMLEAVHVGRLSPRHARPFLPLAAYPALLEGLLADVLEMAEEDTLQPAEDLERQLPWMIQRAGGDQVRPLSGDTHWGPENPLGGKGALFRPGDAIPVKRLTPVLQKQATAEGTFYHPGPCTTCPHGFRAKTRDGICLEPTGACYGIRQTFTASGRLKSKVAAAAAERGRGTTAEKARQKKERLRRAQARARWTKAVAKAQALFRRRRAKPRALYERALYGEVQDFRMDKEQIAVLFARELEAHKVAPDAFKKKPLGILQGMPEGRLQEVLRTVYALEDANRRSWYGGRGWPFKPPVAGLHVGL